MLTSAPRPSLARAARLATAGLALLAPACSVFPPAVMQPSVIQAAELDYDLPLDGAHRIRVPASDEGITVLELHVEPTPDRELFERGRRYLEFAPDVQHVALRYRVRRWAPAAGDGTLTPDDLFPGAVRVRPLPVESPQP